MKLMTDKRLKHEQCMYDTLHRIAKEYQTPDKLRRNAKNQYGLEYEEVLEMAYKNIQAEAIDAIKGQRRPS